MRKAITTAATVATILLLCGCSSPNPTTLAVSTGLDVGFEAIRADAELGIRARQNPDAAALLGAGTISDGQAAFAVETLDYHQRLIDDLRDRELGTIEPDAPLPAGPTRRTIEVTR